MNNIFLNLCKILANKLISYFYYTICYESLFPFPVYFFGSKFFMLKVRSFIRCGTKTIDGQKWGFVKSKKAVLFPVSGSFVKKSWKTTLLLEVMIRCTIYCFCLARAPSLLFLGKKFFEIPTAGSAPVSFLTEKCELNLSNIYFVSKNCNLYKHNYFQIFGRGAIRHI